MQKPKEHKAISAHCTYTHKLSGLYQLQHILFQQKKNKNTIAWDCIRENFFLALKYYKAACCPKVCYCKRLRPFHLFSNNFLVELCILLLNYILLLKRPITNDINLRHRDNCFHEGIY